MKINIKISLYLSMYLLLLPIGNTLAQQVPLGEAIRNRNEQVVQDLNLNTLPSPKEQKASQKEFDEGHWHGLELIYLTKELRQEYDIPSDIVGLLIDESILEAAECGFLAGDVVQAVGKYPIQTLKNFLDASIKMQHKKEVKIQIWRSAQTQALTGDVGVTDALKARKMAQDMPKQGKTFFLTLRVSSYYRNLGYADMSAAPPIQPGAISPHKTRNKPCVKCHFFMNTGGQLAVDAGDILPDPPPISPGSVAPHEKRGNCNFCHKITPKSNKTFTRGGVTPSGKIAALQNNQINQNNTEVIAQQPPPTNFQQQNPTNNLPKKTFTNTPLNQNLPFQQDSSQQIQGPPSMNWLGCAVIPVNKGLARRNKVAKTRGVYINTIDPSSSLKRIGLKKGDIITHIGQMDVTGLARFSEVLNFIQPGEKVEIDLLRRGRHYSVELIIDKDTGMPREYDTHIFRTRTAIVFGIVAFVYLLIFTKFFGRIISFPLGAVLILILGYQFEFYTFFQAINEIDYSILLFIIGMNFITIVLYETGFFSNLSSKIAVFTRGNRTHLFILFCLLTYVISAFVDNIATILVIVPLTLGLAKDLRFDPKPLVIAEIISSNLGGASTMFGDFPNLLISFATQIQFHEFLLYEMPICIIMLVAMFAYMYYSQNDFFRGVRVSGEILHSKDFIKPITNTRAMTKALIVLGGVILGLIFSRPIGINPGIIAFCGGIIVLIISGISKSVIIKNGGWADVIFFASLFIIVGAADSCGIFSFMAQGVICKLSNGNLFVIAILTMYFAAGVTTFMNAGPTAALFIPIVFNYNIKAPHNLFWWALSLGVLTGSSASLYGASGGPLASSLLQRYWKKNKKSADAGSPFTRLEKNLDMKEYMQTGGPIMVIFLMISTVYIYLLNYVF